MKEFRDWPASAVEVRPLAELTPYAKNARTHSAEQVAQIAASLAEWGWTNPVLVDEGGMVIAGHGRLLAAEQLGISAVPVMVARGWSEAQKQAYVLADNQLALNAGWDMSRLAVELSDLQGLGFEMSLLGFSERDMRAAMGAPGLTDPDEVPEAPASPTAKLGDVWLLGPHRLVCGDATDEGAVRAALGGRRADLCLTDPPYGLGSGIESGKNDYATYDDTRENLIDLARKWLPIARAISDVVVFSPGVTNQWLYPEPNWVMCWFYGGGQLRSPWGFNCWQPFLCYGKEPGLASGKGARPDAVDMNTPANASDINHPCPKPVKLWEWFLDRLVFKSNAVVFDPFVGSGTTIIAAEMTGRVCHAIELDPVYIDVAVQRWENFTGQKASLENGLSRNEAAADAPETVEG